MLRHIWRCSQAQAARPEPEKGGLVCKRSSSFDQGIRVARGVYTIDNRMNLKVKTSYTLKNRPTYNYGFQPNFICKA